METIDNRREQDVAEFDRLVDLIRRSGTDSLGFFGNGYTHEGGLSLQQTPEELAALTLLLRGHHPHSTYLEIGSASGGVARFLHSEVGFARMLAIDDGNHPRYPELAANFDGLPMEHLRADSHSEEARLWLEGRAFSALDVAFVDGDHSYDGCWADIELVTPHCRKATLLILHDIVACEGVRRSWEQLHEFGWGHFASYIGASTPGTGPLGIGVAVRLPK